VGRGRSRRHLKYSVEAQITVKHATARMCSRVALIEHYPCNGLCTPGSSLRMQLPLVSPGMITLMLSCSHERTSRGRHASKMCGCLDVASARSDQKHSLVAAWCPASAPNLPCRSPKEDPKDTFHRGRKRPHESLSGNRENAQQTGSGQRSGQLFSCPSEMSKSVRAMRIGAKKNFFMLQKKRRPGQRSGQVSPFLTEASR